MPLDAKARDAPLGLSHKKNGKRRIAFSFLVFIYINLIIVLLTIVTPKNPLFKGKTTVSTLSSSKI